MGSASMSARMPMVGPSPVPICATTPVRPTPVCTSVVADLGQRIGHKLSRAHLLEAQFRVFVDVAAQAHHFVLQGFGLV